MRADRLIALMLLLNTKGRLRAAELAERLEVSERTIYRDVEALSIAGVPVYAQSGANGGIFLDEQYRVALNGLSAQDIHALFLQSDAPPLHDLGLGKTASLLKLLAALPNAQRNEVTRLQQRIHIDPANWFQVLEPLPYMGLLQQAVWEDRCLSARYQPVEGDEGERLLEAYALVAKANVWYLVAKKPNAPLETMRTYRAARLQAVALSEQRFVRDAAFDLPTYWRAACEQFERESLAAHPPCPALLRVHRDAFWYFPAYMEGYYERIGAPDAEGWHTLRVTFPEFSEARGRLLALGGGVIICEPNELRECVLATARAVLARNADA
ncbi:MAG: WYL domain-containing protein [Chloroflexi bacterium CFX4]|nr:WYL domain-containing protein [Chloroflexi bacterium CFX4]MDL1921200.1 WYL domain-containing protein [Chloroflexi bacterium CFX3]